MKAEGLLAHYARIADAPDAITRLRRFVLDLAVRGKLAEQNAEEDSAVHLLAKINQAKEARIALGEIRRPRDLIRDDKIDQPFAVPATWKWIRLDEVGAIVGGGTPSAGDPENFAVPGQGVPWLTPADLGGFKGLYVSTGSRDLSEKGAQSSSATVLPQGTVLFTSRAPIGYVAIAAIPLATNQGFKSVVPYVEECSRFIALVLKTFAPEIDAKAPGTTFKEVSGKIVAGISFPLAPLAEQHRIVAKVDELMALCDQLEAARARREATRDQLAAASLAGLNAPDPDIFNADARFALDALSALTTHPDQIKQLRRTILNLAVRGQLVPQDTNDESANELIALAGIEISEFSKKHRVARNYPAPIEEVPFPTPPSWRWSRMCEIFNVITDGDHQPPPRADEGIAFLTIGNISAGSIDFAGCRLVPETYFRGLPPYRVPSCGDILYTVVGATYGRPVLVDTNRAFCVQRHIAILKPSTAMSTRYLLYLLASSLIYDQASQSATGAAQPTIALKPLRNFLAPVPPINEQHRIVAKVDELMALCDQLEASLTTSETTRSRLLDALLHEALAPAPTVNIEHPRAAVSGYVVSRLASKRNFGRTAHMKHLYLAESRLGLKLGGRYMRQAAGPLDTDIYELEKQAEAAGWYTHNVQTLPSGNEKVSYVPGKALKALAEEGVAVLGDSRKEMDRLIDLMGDLKTEQVEIIATLFAAWNDALLDGHTPDDDWTVKEVREHWHASKQRFTPAELHKWLGWMRQNDVVPLGHPPRTMQQTTMEF